MRKGLVKKFWIFMVSLLMIIGNMQSFVFAEDDNAARTVGGVTYSVDVIVNNAPLTADTRIKNGDELEARVNYKISNLQDYQDGIVTFEIDTQHVTILASNDSSIKYDLYDEDNSFAGHYAIVTDPATKKNYIQLEIDPEYRATHSNLTGYINLHLLANYVKDDKKDNGKVDFTIGNHTGEFTYESGEAPSSASVYKSPSGNIRLENGKYYQDYSITISRENNHGSLNITEFTDLPGNNIKPGGSVIVKKSYTEDVIGTYTFNDQYQLIDNNGSIAAITLNDTCNSITLTYSAEVDKSLTDLMQYADNKSDANAEVSGLNNVFKIKYKNDNNEDQEKTSNNANININPISVSKIGDQPKDGKIQWTIKINVGSYGELSGKVFNDLISSIKDTPGAGLVKGNTDLDPSLFERDRNDKNLYTYTYTTDIDSSVNLNTGYTFQNKVVVKIGEIEEPPKTATVTVKPKDLLQKTLVDKDGDYLNWQVRITLVKGMKSVELCDSLQSENLTSEDGIIKLGDEVIAQYGDIDQYNKGEVVKNDSVLESASGANIGGMWSTITLNFKDDWVNAQLGDEASKTIVLNYRTKITKYEDKHVYKNQAKLKYDLNGTQETTSEASWLYRQEVTKTAEVKSNRIDYTIKFNLLSDFSCTEGSTYKIKDTLLNDDFMVDGTTVEGQVYRWDGFNKHGDNDTYGIPFSNETIDYDNNKHEFTYVLSKKVLDAMKAYPDNPAFYVEIKYSAIPKDINKFYQNCPNGTTEEVQNTVEVYKERKVIGQATTTTNIAPESVVHKTGYFKEPGTTQNPQFATFKIDLNENGVKLNGGKSLKGEDQLSSSLSFVLGTLKVQRIRAL